MMDEYEERRGFMVGEGNIYTERKRGQKGVGGVCNGRCWVSFEWLLVVGTLPPSPPRV
jgi:hypothetical protein